MIGSRAAASSAEVTYRQQFRHCNKPECARCRDGGRGHGPYWFAYWREGGKQRMRYLGKEAPQQGAAAAPAAASTTLRVRTLGGFAAWCGSTAIPDSVWSQRKQTLLFKCLLSSPGHRLHREQAIDLFWPDHDPAHAARLLRQTLHRLRRSLDVAASGRRYVCLEGDHVVLAPSLAGDGDGWLDALAFERAAHFALAGANPAACRAALALYSGDYLPGDPYEEWAITRREFLRGRYIALLLHLASLREGQGALGEAMRCLHTVLVVEPCHEEAARALMRMQAAAGRHVDAMRTFHRLAEAMRRDLDLAPDAATDAQYLEIQQLRQSRLRKQSNLPTPLTSFVGRDEVLEELAKLLAGLCRTGHGQPASACPPRLVTIVGAGGCGKSRLAVELGTELRSRYEGGVWLVELAGLAPTESSDVDPILRQCAGALEIRPRPDQPLIETLRGVLASRRTLLIVDNCEHVLASCVAFAADLLPACPDLQLLATSRQALGIVGEVVWRLPSLSVPPASACASHSPADLNQYAAVRLLVERAQAVKPRFILSVDNGRPVVGICRRLDGIPLAIELVAARLAVLSCEELERRLTQQFQLLVSGNGAALPRHQTLHAVIDWGYRLLSASEQAFLRLLSVFAGGWTLDAVEEVYAGHSIDDAGVLDALVRLAGKSLVEHEETAEGSSRYRLLETLRQFAAQRLREQGEEAWARSRHLQWCAALAERAAPALSGPNQQVWLDRLEIEHDNLRAALVWCIQEAGDANAGQRLAGSLGRFWAARGYWHEGRRWLSAALAQPGGTPANRLRSLFSLGHLVINQGDHTLARAVHEECLALGRALPDEGVVATALNGLGNVARFQGNLEQAAALYEESLAIYRQAGDKPNIARALVNLAIIAQERGEYRRAIVMNEDALAYWHALGDRAMVGYTRLNASVCHRLAGECERAASLLGIALSVFTELRDRSGINAVHHEAGRIAYEQGEYPTVIAHLRAATRGFLDLGDRASLIEALQNWAMVIAHQASPARAARLLGAVETAQIAVGHPLPPGVRAVFMADVARVRELLGAGDIFAAKWAEGEAMTLDSAIAEVLAL